MKGEEKIELVYVDLREFNFFVLRKFVERVIFVLKCDYFFELEFQIGKGKDEEIGDDYLKFCNILSIFVKRLIFIVDIEEQISQNYGY